jgi:predicted  nucleic acid-binding Zn-ribbon protein
MAGEVLARKREEIGALVSPTTRDLDATRVELREARARAQIELRQTRERLEAQIAQLRADIAEVRAAWKRDVAGLDRELKVFYDAIAEAEARLDAALAEP